MINIERVENNLRTIGQIGMSESGLNRLAFSKEYYESINALKEYSEQQ